ncbi:MAG: chromosome segregation protein SMC [Burkholderiales bacterium]
MRLTHIKLAGFKSFVDPTHIPVPGHLVGVVGPNGCGKSNVIDAVRWVLGESSAKQLRGESMQDVIFNGSVERKPVSRASVELIFDNSLSKAAGPWSNYAEISLKRVLERDGESSYYINNQHVRRRDVADIFLGTGLGGRGYAIIEQGMISRIIEAKPEDLRNFLEEAAGVSKYRERRRETELRLEDARENLLRVDDIRQELGNQLAHLEAQAQQAARYRELDQQLKTTQQLLWLTRKRDAAAQRNRIKRDLDAVTLDIEAEAARLREAERQVETLRAGHYAASDSVHAAQGQLYEANAEVARLEQQVQHLRDTRLRTEKQLAAVRSQEQEQRAKGEHSEAMLSDSNGELRQARERVEQLLSVLDCARKALPAAEQAHGTAREKADEAQRALSRAEQRLELEQTRHAHSEKLLAALAARKSRLEDERDALELPEPSELVRLDRELQELLGSLAERREALSVAETQLPEMESAALAADQVAETRQLRLNQLDARLAALQQLQEQVSRAGELGPWLERNALSRNSRMWQGLRIRVGWEDALEAVLRERLNSIGLQDLSAVHALFTDPPPGKVSFHQLAAAPTDAGTAPPQGLVRLADYVTCSDPRLAAVLADWIDRVYVLEDVSRGVELAHTLPPGTMLVTARGHVFSATSASFHAADSETHGILSRQREIDTLVAEHAEVDREHAVAREQARNAQSDLDHHRALLEQYRSDVAALQEAQHQLKVDHIRLSELAERVTSRGTQIVRELAEIEVEWQRETAQMEAAAQIVSEINIALDGLKSTLRDTFEALAQAEAALKARRDEAQMAEREHHEAVFSQKSIQQKISEIESSLQQITELVARLAADAQRLATEVVGADEAPLQEALQAALGRQAQCERALATVRDALQGAEAELRDTERSRLSAVQKIAPLRERIQELRLKEQEARLAEENFAQQLADAGADEEALAPHLDRAKRATQLQADMARLNAEITALGAVNLAALEELAISRERKSYLDSQAADLTEAVTTLESAIRRIDRETRERLQVTFDQVNMHLAEMFPALFGGGEAKLVMTGEEILDAGIQVMARPPGKRNSTIHLLSGGEKALTALALVFSLFQLNPAPFCLLDEVDAPLDDNNTVRFCDLVKKMSDSTQFMFITHNKITMELAQQLVGVTMQEQGVSRVVAVDIEEALRMREEAA